MAKKSCGDPTCVRYEMSQLEFRRLRGELWDMGFISRFGKLASKLYREIYKKHPDIKRRPRPGQKRWPVHRYPCGILEQAYRQLREQGVPLVKKESALQDMLITNQYERWKDLEYYWQRAWNPNASKTSRKETLGS
jgi:hypothetical protein